MAKDEKMCPSCGGTGEDTLQPGRPGEKPITRKCPQCNGSGTVPA